jgi:hypothetical protein
MCYTVSYLAVPLEHVLSATTFEHTKRYEGDTTNAATGHIMIDGVCSICGSTDKHDEPLEMEVTYKKRSGPA